MQNSDTYRVIDDLDILEEEMVFDSTNNEDMVFTCFAWSIFSTNCSILCSF